MHQVSRETDKGCGLDEAFKILNRRREYEEERGIEVLISRQRRRANSRKWVDRLGSLGRTCVPIYSPEEPFPGALQPRLWLTTTLLCCEACGCDCLITTRSGPSRARIQAAGRGRVRCTKFEGERSSESCGRGIGVWERGGS